MYKQLEKLVTETTRQNNLRSQWHHHLAHVDWPSLLNFSPLLPRRSSSFNNKWHDFVLLIAYDLDIRDKPTFCLGIKFLYVLCL